MMFQRLIIVAIICCALLFSAAQAGSSCTFNADGKKFTLPNVTVKSVYQGDVAYLNMCENVPDCTTHPDNICAVRPGAKDMSFASATESPAPVAKHVDNTLVLRYENSDVACFSTDTFVMVPTKTNVYVDCGSSNQDNWSIHSTRNCEYEIHVKLACGAGDDGLSGGAIFLIVVFVCFAAYMIIGALLNKFYFKNNQIIPQQAFWCSLPGLYIAGCKFSINFTRAKISGGKASVSDSDSYDQV